MFKGPLPSLDPDFNPRSIRVTYEVDSGGEEFWVGGVDAQVKVSDRLQVDAIAVEDRNPQDRRQLHGLNATVKVAEGTYLVAEVARSEAQSIGRGDGRRIELRHESVDLQAQAYVADTDATFDNPGAWLAGGRAESGARATWRLNDRTLLRGEALRTEDELNGGRRTGAFASIERTVARDVRVERRAPRRGDRDTRGRVEPARGLAERVHQHQGEDREPRAGHRGSERLRGIRAGRR